MSRIICRQLLADHVVGSRAIKGKKNHRVINICYWDIFTSLAVFWRARMASQNTRDE